MFVPHIRPTVEMFTCRAICNVRNVRNVHMDPMNLWLWFEEAEFPIHYPGLGKCLLFALVISFHTSFINNSSFHFTLPSKITRHAIVLPFNSPLFCVPENRQCPSYYSNPCHSLLSRIILWSAHSPRLPGLPGLPSHIILKKLNNIFFSSSSSPLRQGQHVSELSTPLLSLVSVGAAVVNGSTGQRA